MGSIAMAESGLDAYGLGVNHKPGQPDHLSIDCGLLMLSNYWWLPSRGLVIRDVLDPGMNCREGSRSSRSAAGYVTQSTATGHGRRTRTAPTSAGRDRRSTPPAPSAPSPRRLMTLPVDNLTKPADLADTANGQLADPPLAGFALPERPSALLHHIAARAFRAFFAEVRSRFGVELSASSTVDCYRNYTVQRSTFLARYTTTPLEGRPTKRWNGVTYWQRPGTAIAATPGTSNHGWGLAVDVAVAVPLNGGGHTIVGITSRPRRAPVDVGQRRTVTGCHGRRSPSRGTSGTTPATASPKRSSTTKQEVPTSWMRSAPTCRLARRARWFGGRSTPASSSRVRRPRWTATSAGRRMRRSETFNGSSG
jgi:hypothetical protein